MQKKKDLWIYNYLSNQNTFPTYYKKLYYKIEIRWNFIHFMFKKLLYRSLNMILQDNNISKNKTRMNAYKKKSDRKNN